MTTAQPCNVHSLVNPYAASPERDRSIGAILIDSGRLTADDVERILREQKEKGLRFGEAAVSLGLVKQEDIQYALSHQFDYPYLMPGSAAVSNEVIAAYDPFGRQVEALRALRGQLMLRWFGNEPQRKALAIVSPGRGEGRSYLAANLAVVFSQLGERTLLIDADMRHPRQHELFGLPNRSGLSAILSGRTEGSAVERIPVFLDLSVLTAGAIPPNPVELLGRQTFAGLLEGLAGVYDVIIVDTPAAAIGGDAQTIALRAGASLLVARKNRTQMGELQDLAADLSQSNAVVVGSVLNSF